MEQARLLIAIVLSALIFLLWQLFFVDQEATRQTAKKSDQPPVKEEQAKEAQPYPQQPAETRTAKTPGTGEERPAPARIPRSIVVETPFYKAELSEKGAGFTSFVLKKYRENVAKDSPLQELLPQEKSIQTVLLGSAGKSLPGLENAVFSANLNEDSVNVGDAAREIKFSWRSEEGVVVEKTFKFLPDSYVIGLDVAIKNGSDRSIQ